LKKLQDENPGRIGELYEDIGRKSGAAKILTLKSPTDDMERILVPESLRTKLILWYHRMLVHPGTTRLYNTLRQHYIWPKMQDSIADVIRPCKPCQIGKRGERGYGEIPLKDIETAPWRDVCLDLSGPWKTTINGKEVHFHALTAIDPFTSWIEIIPVLSKTGPHITSLFEQEWLRRYPRPGRVIYDQGSEFQNEDFYKLCAKWNLLLEPITTANPQANSIVERVHRIMGDMIRVQLTQQHEHDDPIRDIFTAAAYGIRATVHGTTLFTPGQIVFNKDMILRTNILVNTELIRQRRHAAAVKNNIRENKRRIPYKYQPGGKVLLLTRYLDPKLKLKEGPFTIESVNPKNGILHIKRGQYVEPISMRLVRPYFGKQR